jgi:ribosomal protein L3 glutamine methyltransferase
MKPPAANADSLFRGTTRVLTLGDWLDWAVRAYDRHALAFGQVADNARDEALYLLLRTLDLPLDSRPAVLRRTLQPEQVGRIKEVLRRRILDRTPAAYLTREAWLGGHRFYVDERVIIPRSYFVELMPQLGELVGGAHAVRHVVDVCTGSGCLAILLARQFPGAAVDAIDLSADALAVARENVRAHQLEEQIRLYASDVFDAVPRRRYELILSNPPYEPSAHCDALPPEFRHEPRLALDGGTDGLVIIRKLLEQARERLVPQGVVVIEVGGLRGAMEAAFPTLPIEWLSTADGSDCVCVIRAQDLRLTARARKAVQPARPPAVGRRRTTGSASAGRVPQS